MKRYIAIILSSALSYCLLSVPANAKTLQIVVSIKPLHALVSGLTQDIIQPQLLIQGMESPHDYSLKPSERRMLESADVVIYASDQIESFIPALTTSRQRIALDQLPHLPLLPARGTHAHHGDHDSHIWLSPSNAKIIVQQLAIHLSQLDPVNQERYFKNRDALSHKLDALQQRIRQQLKPTQSQVFLQFHDALQYFERDFELHSITVTTGSEHAPGARHIRELQQQIKQQNIRCFIYEPPQAPKLMQTLNVNHNARIQAIEIHGSQLQSGENLYFELLQNMATQLQNCMIP